MDFNHLDKWLIVLSFPTKPSVCDVEASIKELLQVSLDAKAAGEWTTTEPFDYEGDSTSLFRPDAFTDVRFTKRKIVPCLRPKLASAVKVADLRD